MPTYDKDKIDQIDLRRIIENETGKAFKAKGSTDFIQCPMHKDAEPGSLALNKDGDLWNCHGACGVGGDGIRFIELSKSLSYADALKYLAETYDNSAILNEDAPKPAKGKTPGRKATPKLPIPDSALTEALPNTVKGDWWVKEYGEFKAAWRYHMPDGGVAYIDARFEMKKDGKIKKSVVPLYWAKIGRWKMGIPADILKQPRLLYNLHKLVEHPDKPVLVVEGCKCASANTPGLRDAYTLTTWPQGSNGIPKVDVRPLYARKVVIWPDNDMTSQKFERGGYKAAYHLAEKLNNKSEVIILRAATAPGDKETKHGYDIADYIEDGGDPLEYISNPDNFISLSDAMDLAGLLPPDADETPDFRDVGKFTVLDMPHIDTQSKVLNGLDRNDKHNIMKSDGNFLHIVEADPAFRYLVAYDTATNQLMHSKVYTELDEMDNKIWQYAQRYYEIAPSKAQRTDMVKTIAYRNSYNSLEVFLDELKAEIFGDIKPTFERNPLDEILEHMTFSLEDEYTDIAEINKLYTEIFHKYFMRMFIKLEYIIMGDVGNAPPADIVPILEGGQGIGKTRFCWFISVNPQKYYVDMADLQLTNSRDTLASIRGKLIGELGELAGLKRTELESIKAFISRPTDPIRRLYTESLIESPRTVSFIGSTNEREYLRDTTGNRRFWPIRINSIDNDLYSKRDLAKQLYIYYRELAKKSIAAGTTQLDMLPSDALDEFMTYQREEKRVQAYFIDDLMHYIVTQENLALSDEPVKLNVTLAARELEDVAPGKPVKLPPRFQSEFDRIVAARGYVRKVGMMGDRQRRYWQLDGRICAECKQLKEKYMRFAMIGEDSRIVCDDCDTSTKTPEGDPF